MLGSHQMATVVCLLPNRKRTSEKLLNHSIVVNTVKQAACSGIAFAVTRSRTSHTKHNPRINTMRKGPHST